MDENSCEGETSESANNVSDGESAKKPDDVSQLENVGVRMDPGGEEAFMQVSERCGSSVDASVSGPSTNFPFPEPRTENEEVRAVIEELLRASAELSRGFHENENNVRDDSLFSSEAESQEELSSSVAEAHELQAQTEPVPENLETRPVTIGPPPSYSFVMKQKQKKKSAKLKLTEPIMANRPPPPPTYSGNRGLCLPPEESRLERICNLQPLWRSHSQPALCPRCGIIILTTIHSHDSVATHVAALALCLFGCWPCCLLPYCMNACKNTYHHCPICQSFLGAYTPW